MDVEGKRFGIFHLQNIRTVTAQSRGTEVLGQVPNNAYFWHQTRNPSSISTSINSFVHGNFECWCLPETSINLKWRQIFLVSNPWLNHYVRRQKKSINFIDGHISGQEKKMIYDRIDGYSILCCIIKCFSKKFTMFQKLCFMKLSLMQDQCRIVTQQLLHTYLIFLY